MPNGIDLNSITPDFRDFLLSRNLILSQTIANSGYSSLAAGLGFTTNIGDMEGLVDGKSLDDISLEERTLDTSQNKFKNDTPNDQTIIGTTPVALTSKSLDDISLEERTIDISQNSFRSDVPNDQTIIGTTPVTQIYNDEYSNNLSSQVINNELSIISEEILNASRSRNYYIDSDPQQVTIDYGTPSFDNQVDNYLDTSGKLNLDGPSTQVLDVAGGLLSGQSPLIGNDGTLASTSDVRTGLVGRTLGALGAIDDTPLGIIAGQELGRQLVNNLGRNAVQATVGKVNTSVTDLLRGGSIFVPNYKITNNAESTIADLTGFNLGRGLDKDLFFGGKAVGNIDRANKILEVTGKGQTNLLLSNLRLNRFRAGLTGMEPGPFGYVYMNEGLVDHSVLESNLFPKPFGDERDLSVSTPINDSYLKEQLFEDVETLKTVTDNTFTWDSDSGGVIDSDFITRLNTSPDSILDKTKRLFDSGFVRTLDGREFAEDTKSEIQSGIKKDKISKGSAVLDRTGEDFCRVWTKKRPYSTVEDLQKHENIRLGDTTQKAHSVLDTNGFVRMSPISGDNSLIKKYMLSLENLAWADSTKFDDLLPCEKGINGGRIMWFPPYDISFTDNTSAKWDSHEFIGRPEPMYTYNSSERTGNLSFKIVVDNPSAINAIRESSFSEGLNDLVDSYFAGCRDDIPESLGNVLSNAEQEALNVALASQLTTKAIDPVQPFEPFSVYFLNDVHVYESTYENGSGTAYINGGEYTPSVLNGGDGSSTSDNDRNPGNRNVIFNDIIDGTELKDYIDKHGKSVQIEIYGYASAQGTSERNQILSDKRVKSISDILKNKYGEDTFTLVTEEGRSSQGSGSPEQAGVSSTTNMKDARRVDIKITVNPELDDSKNSADKPETINGNAVQQAKDKIVKRLFTECTYFSKLEETDEFAGAVDKIYEKIKYFTPAFHSMTPEGFNSRLTFLLQCTKPGETVYGKSSPDNLAFGKPPVCVLRVGDFYHTKIIIDTVNFSFDPLLWDLNPEGIGVQPMVANVDIGFKFVGGSSLEGPIKQLQNAVAFNFFANTEVYDDRATKGNLIGERENEKDEISEDLSQGNITPEKAKSRTDELNEEISRLDPTEVQDNAISPDDIVISRVELIPAVNTNNEVVGTELITTFKDKNNRLINFSDNVTETISYRFVISSISQATDLDLGVVDFPSENKTFRTFKFFLGNGVDIDTIKKGFIIGGTSRKKI